MSQIHAASYYTDTQPKWVTCICSRFTYTVAQMNFLAQVYLSKWQVVDILRGQNHFTHLSCSACCFCITSTHRKRPEATDADPSFTVCLECGGQKVLYRRIAAIKRVTSNTCAWWHCSHLYF